MVGPFYYATAENRYDTVFLPTFPTGWRRATPPSSRGLFESWGFGVPWQAWLIPLAAWTAFTLATYVLMLCVLTIFRRQWIERERLLFPLVAVPLEVIEPAPRGAGSNEFFRNPYHVDRPDLRLRSALLQRPATATSRSLPQAELFIIGGKPVPTAPWGRPWNAIGTLQFQFAPLIVGLSFLLTREVSLSLWLFYWLANLETVLGTAVGLDGVGVAVGRRQLPLPGPCRLPAPTWRWRA